ncbi:hypothetical protein SAMN05880574_1297 [Chryseobacterium sp. RU37D]|nr:hypothetical protein SAMN05880574_1297 [Chryseobacterium sp. RU37D]
MDTYVKYYIMSGFEKEALSVSTFCEIFKCCVSKKIAQKKSSAYLCDP